MSSELAATFCSSGSAVFWKRASTSSMVAGVLDPPLSTRPASDGSIMPSAMSTANTVMTTFEASERPSFFSVCGAVDLRFFLYCWPCLVALFLDIAVFASLLY